VPGTVIGTGLPGARLALVAGEALALAGVAVAVSLPSALDVLVMTPVGVRAVYPRQLVGAETVGTIASGLSLHAPARIATARFILLARAVSAAKARASCVGEAAKKGREGKCLEEHGTGTIVVKVKSSRLDRAISILFWFDKNE